MRAHCIRATAFTVTRACQLTHVDNENGGSSANPRCTQRGIWNCTAQNHYDALGCSCTFSWFSLLLRQGGGHSCSTFPFCCCQRRGCSFSVAAFCRMAHGLRKWVCGDHVLLNHLTTGTSKSLALFPRSSFVAALKIH